MDVSVTFFQFFMQKLHPSKRSLIECKLYKFHLVVHMTKVQGALMMWAQAGVQPRP